MVNTKNRSEDQLIAQIKEKENRIQELESLLNHQEQNFGKFKKREISSQSIIHAMNHGYAHQKIIVEGGVPCDYEFLEVNKAFEILTGLRSENILGRRVTEVLPGIENDPADWIGVYGKVALGNSPITFESYSEPLKRWYSVSAFSPEKGYFVTIFSDVSKQIDERSQYKKLSEDLKYTEKKLKMHMEKLLKAQQVAKMGFLDWNLETNQILLSSEVTSLYGLDPATEWITPDLVAKVVHPDDLNYVQSNLEMAAKGGKKYNIDHRVVRPDGKVLWVQAQGELTRDEEGNPQTLLGTVVDITERKQAEEALRESTKLFTQFMDYFPAAAFIKDKDFKTLFVNKCFKENFGGERWIGKTVADLFPEEVARKMNADDQKAMDEGLQIITEEVKDIHNELHTYQTFKFPIKQKNEETLLGGFAINITKQKQAEEAQIRSEEMYHDLYENAPDMYVSVDPQTAKIIRCNQTLAKTLGYTKAEIIDKQIFELYHPDSMEHVKIVFQLFMKTGEIHGVELQLQRKDGSKIDVSLNVSAVYDEHGNILNSRSALRDITERKILQEKLNQERLLFERAINSLDHPFYIIDSNDFTVKLANSVTKEFYGDFTQPITCHELTHNESKPCLGTEHQCPVFEVIKTKKPLIVEHCHFDSGGSSKTLELHCYPIFDQEGNVNQVIEYSLDITLRKQAEEALKESTKLFTQFMDYLPASVFIKDKDFKILFTNKYAKDTFGGEEWIGKTAAELFPEEIARRMIAEDQKAMNEGLQIFTEEIPDIHNNLHTYQTFKFPIKQKNEETLLGGIAVDITKRKQTEKELKRSKESYQAIFESSPVGIGVVDFDGRVLTNNNAISSITGYTSEELQNIDIGSNFTKEGELEKLIKTLNEEGRVRNHEVKLRRKNGEIYDASLSIDVIDQGGKKLLQTVLLDVTEQKKAETERLKYLRKKDQFVTMTTHELRTPLTVFRGYIDFLQKYEDLSQQRIDECLNEMRRSCDRLENLIGKTSAVAKLDRDVFPIYPIVFELDILLQEVKKTYKDLFQDPSNFDVSNIEGSVQIMGDKDRLEQIINNLLENAIQHTSKETRRISLSVESLSNKILIKISDNGAGVVKENLERIFEQFVSIPTDFHLGGTGVGLYISKQIAEAHGGKLFVESRGKGKGSKFILELPHMS